MRSPLDLRNSSWIVVSILFLHLLAADCDVHAADDSQATIDLTAAVVVAPADLSPRETKAVSMLVEEVAKRSQIQWSVSHDWPEPSQLPVIAVGRDDNLRRDFPHTIAWLDRIPAPSGAEGYRVQTPHDTRDRYVG